MGACHMKKPYNFARFIYGGVACFFSLATLLAIRGILFPGNGGCMGHQRSLAAFQALFHGTIAGIFCWRWHFWEKLASRHQARLSKPAELLPIGSPVPDKAEQQSTQK